MQQTRFLAKITQLLSKTTHLLDFFQLLQSYNIFTTARIVLVQ
ncbi:hypothetical protein GGD38_002582 [Chitinophagaceae bacterium OAS944]|nr:hypothetical protein [Chitinophagaceae bacterium OAS944]